MRSRSLWLPLAAAVLLAIWLLLPVGGPPAQDPGPDVGPAAPDSEPGLLEASVPILPVPILPVGAGAGPVLASGGRGVRRRVDLASAIVTVRSLSGTVRAGLPVRVRDPGAPQPTRYHLSDLVGEVHLERVPLDGSVVVEALASWSQRTGRVVGSVAVRAPTQDLVCDGSLALEVRCLDAVTGARVELDLAPTRMPAEASDAARVGVLPGQRTTVGLEVPLEARAAWRRQGYVAWDPSKWKSTISRYARRLSMTYPMRRSARVQVFAHEHDGTPTDRARIAGFELAGRTLGEKFSTSSYRGGFVVQGVPFLRDEPLKVLVLRPPAEVPEAEGLEEIEECADVEVVDVEHEFEEAFEDLDDFAWFETHPGAAIGSGRLPHGWHEWLVVNAVFPANAEEDVLWGRGDTVTISCSSCGPRRRDGPKGAVSVTVHRRDGRPAVGALVRVGGATGRTDARGRAVLRDIVPGEHEVRLREPGLVACSGSVTVRADRMARATLREAKGTTVRVRVVDEDGEGLPFAILELPSATSWADLDEAGVQRIDPFTDVRGRRELRRFPAGRWRFVASYGSRSAGVEATVAPGSVQTVTVTLPSGPEPR